MCSVYMSGGRKPEGQTWVKKKSTFAFGKRGDNKAAVLDTWETKEHADLFPLYPVNKVCNCFWLLASSPKREILSQLFYTGKE